MADPDALAALKDGWESWDKWRKSRDLFDAPDLTNCDLSGINFDNGFFTGVDFSGSNLSSCSFAEGSYNGAKFNGCSMRNAWLAGYFEVASFEGADLSCADFYHSDFVGASFKGANLTEAKLERSNLSYADLSGANLAGAILAEVLFLDTDLSHAQGLNSCDHWGPSACDFLTIRKSWPIALPFLKGTGIDAALIALLVASSGNNPEYSTCFISYSSKDDQFVRDLHEHLTISGVQCWFAPEDLKIGERIRPSIDRAILAFDKVIVVLSENSIGSAWVEKEVETAFEKENETRNTILLPIRIDDSVMGCKEAWAADLKRMRNIGDFSSWRDAGRFSMSRAALLDALRK
jgi:uncharacterized protein YjbI with pentapeptide repeats